MTKTFSAKSESVQRKWFLVDAKGKTLGRLASEIARRLRGKHKAEYTPHVDTGDYIVVINAEGVKVTGNKANDKIYYHHSGYPGGLKQETFAKKLARKPIQIIELAVQGCYLRTFWDVKCFASLMFIKVINIRMLHNNLKFWKFKIFTGI